MKIINLRLDNGEKMFDNDLNENIYFHVSRKPYSKSNSFFNQIFCHPVQSLLLNEHEKK